MAHTKSAKKHLRKSRKARILNKSKRSAAKTYAKYVLDAVNAGDLAKAEERLPLAFKRIDKCAKTNVIHPNKAARMKSYLMSKVNALRSASTKTE
ncbi:MAG: 30S ribosomal protein S20 [Planctomycetota bacterium]|nr:30S ribosomal protein S20 [Planctomycetota bacterium]